MILEGKRILVLGGTGSLGKTVVRRLLGGELGRPEKVIVFSRDEAKQHDMRLSYLHRRVATDEVIYHNWEELLTFRIGDIRDYVSLVQALNDAEVVIHAAALKQVPTCEYFPGQAVQTNIFGAMNLVRALGEASTPVETVVGVSTDKACKPINVMGMTKALAERIMLEANLECPNMRIMCVRYGNVIASRGSVIPLFLDQIASGGPVTVTNDQMTRFLLTLGQAVDTVFEAIRTGEAGDTLIPRVPAARMRDVATALIDGRDVSVEYIGVRPGEKIHEILISEEECLRTVERGGYYVIRPILPELVSGSVDRPGLGAEYSSANVTLEGEALAELLRPSVQIHDRNDVHA